VGKIVISENVTLDGVIQDPAGDEGFRHGGWVGLIKDHPQLNKLTLDEAMGTEALLLGRRSYEWFARPVAIPERRVGGQVEQPAQVRRVLDSR
jgi:dihydrofolate reductase